MFRKKMDKDSILEQIEAKSHSVDLNVNANKFFGGAVGFGSGISIGGTLGAAAGAAVGAAGFGVGALVTTPLGYLIGAAIGSSIAVPIGRHVAAKIAINEQGVHRDTFAGTILMSNLIVPEVIQEITRIQKLTAALYQSTIVHNSRSNFFDQLDAKVFSPTQKKLYSMLLDQHILKTQFSMNRNYLKSWKDREKASIFLNTMQRDLSIVEMAIIDLTLDYINEKKLDLTNKNLDSSPTMPRMAFHAKGSSNQTTKILNALVFNILWTEKDEECDAIVEKGIQEWVEITKIDSAMFERKYEHKYEHKHEQKESAEIEAESVIWYSARARR